LAARHRMRSIVVIVAVLLFAGPTFAQKVSIDYDETVDFSSYRTYSWKGCRHMDDDSLLTSANSLTEQRVRNSVNEQLTAKGVVEVENGADFYVTCMGQRQGQRRLEADYAGAWGRGWRYGWGPGWTSVRTVEWTEGLLILDIVDAKSERLAWRAHCTATIDDPSKIGKKIRAAVGKAFKRFPPSAR
jgi:hypothetical protein